jgi:TonB family protein
MSTIRRLLSFSLTLGLQTLAFAQPRPAPLQADFGEAILREWIQPEYPASAAQAKLEGEVTIEFAVEVDGSVSRSGVTKSSDEQFNANALAAVQRWKFAPAIDNGKPVASGMRVVVAFKLAQLSQKQVPVEPPLLSIPTQLPLTAAKLTTTPAPDYPVELADRRLPGQVILEFDVETDGTISAPKVRWASHAAFVGEALRTLTKYRFEPAHQGPLPVKSIATQGEMAFESLGADREELLAVNQISVIEPEKFQKPPRPTILPAPVYPREQLLAGEAGSASVEFTVTDRGATTDVLLREASLPEFGAALIAAVEAWAFEPAYFTEAPAAAKLVVAYKFIPTADVSVNRLALTLRTGGAGVAGAGGLDQRLRPIWRAQPVYPQSLQGEKPGGKAVIEFVIDQEGRARLPRVVSASHPEFGWSAATAISQWVFAGPLRGGQPVDVKVSIPVDFAPPKD